MKHLILKKSLSASVDIPFSIVWSIVYRIQTKRVAGRIAFSKKFKKELYKLSKGKCMIDLQWDGDEIKIL